MYINDKKTEIKLVRITRDDLSVGQKIAQSVHSTANFAQEHPQPFIKWKEDTNSVVCLSAKHEMHLLQLWEKFKEQTSCSIFYEPDVSAYTSLCLYADESIRKQLRNLPLIGKEVANV